MFSRGKLILSTLCGMILALTPVTSVVSARSSSGFVPVQSTQETNFQSKFEDLPPEYRERAQKLGYKAGDSVTLGKDASGNLIVLPPVEGNASVEQLKAKLMQVVGEKVLKKVEMPLNVKATLNPEDFTGYFTVESTFKNLKDDLQNEASKLGFKKDDTVKVRVDAKSWEIKVASKETSFPANLLKIIPPKEPNGKPTLIIATKFNDMPPVMQKRASEAGYSAGETVVVQDHGGGSSWEFVPRASANAMLPKAVAKSTFRIGLRSPFAKLQKKEQAKAKKLGYKDGDTVWTRIDDKGKSDIISASEAGDGPETEILEGEFDPVKNQLVLLGITKVQNLNPDLQVKAAAMGFKPEDFIGVRIGQGTAGIMSRSETDTLLKVYDNIRSQK